MNGNEIAETVAQLLDNPDIDPRVARRLMVALTLDTRMEFQTCSTSVSLNFNKLETLIETQSDNIARLESIISRHEEYLQKHPSLVYLLRYRTKESAVVILSSIMILSLWYVSGIRQPILKWLGWPVF